MPNCVASAWRELGSCWFDFVAFTKRFFLDLTDPPKKLLSHNARTHALQHCTHTHTQEDRHCPEVQVKQSIRAEAVLAIDRVVLMGTRMI